MNHLTSDALIDAMEGMLDAARQSHLDTCDECRRELAQLSSVLREARDIGVPEPSPLFWQHFSARVRTAVDAEAPPSGGWRHAGAPSAAAGLGWKWLRWPVLAPLGALALVMLALIVSMPRQMEPPPARAVHDTAPDTLAANDVALAGDSWVLVADLVGEMDWDTASAAGLVVRPGVAEQAVLELSAEEQQELTRLLRAELQRAKS